MRSNKELDYSDELKKIRKKLGMTQKQFAEKFNISVRTLQQWEQGRAKINPTLLELIKRDSMYNVHREGEDTGNHVNGAVVSGALEKNQYKVIRVGDEDFEVVYGKCVETYFCAILNRRVCCKIECPSDFEENKGRLAKILAGHRASSEIAKLIHEISL